MFVSVMIYKLKQQLFLFTYYVLLSWRECVFSVGERACHAF